MKLAGQHAKQDDMIIVAHLYERVAVVVCLHMQGLISVTRAFKLKGVEFQA